MKSEDKTRGYLRLLLKTSFIVFISVFIAKLLNYGYKLIIARQFGPEVYGLFSLSLVVISFFTSIASLGLFEGIVRYISLYRGKNKNQKIKSIVLFSLKLSGITSIAAAIIMFFSAEFAANVIFHNRELAIFLKIFSLSLPFSIISSIYLGTLRAFEKITSYSFVMNIIQNLSRVIALVLLIILGLKSNSVGFSYLISILVLAIISYLLGNRVIKNLYIKKNIKKHEEREIYLELMNYSWPLMLAGITFSMLYWCDSLLIGYYRDMTQVGFYSMAITLVSLLAIVPDLFLQLFFPLIVKEYSSKNNNTIKQLTKQVTKWIFLVNFPVFLIMIIFPGVIINLLFGSNFLVAENALRILSISALMGSFSSTFNSILSMRGRSKTILYNFIVFAFLNILLNFLLVPKFGITGAAIATASTWILITLTQTIQIYTDLRFFPFRRKMFRIAFVSIIPAIILLTMSKTLPATLLVLTLSGFVFLLTYLGLIFLTRCLDKYDLNIIKSLKDKLKNNYLTKKL
jgi:O-antigen/teichoic acid export membrane protein